MNPSILRLLQNLKRDWENPVCNCAQYAEQFKVNAHVSTTADAILKKVGCSKKTVLVLSNLDPANSVAVFEDWFVRAAQPLAAFCKENLPSVRASWGADIRDMYEICNNKKMSAAHKEFCLYWEEFRKQKKYLKAFFSDAKQAGAIGVFMSQVLYRGAAKNAP